MDKFDVMGVNEKQRLRIDYLLNVIENQDIIMGRHIELINELESEIKILKEQIEQQTDWRNFVQ